MRINAAFLKSKVSKRVFSLFILCALLPILVLAFVSFAQVRKQLDRQSRMRLSQSTKALGMSIYERLSFLENGLAILAPKFSESQIHFAERLPAMSNKGLKGRFKGMSYLSGSETRIPFFGDFQTVIPRSPRERQHLLSGKTSLLTKFGEDNAFHIYMRRAIDPRDLEKGTLLVEVDDTYLWGLQENNTLPNMTELCVLDQDNRVIYSTLPRSSSFFATLVSRTNRSSVGQFDWKDEDKSYLACFWSIPLKYKFFHSKWTIVLSESKEYIFAPMASFKRTFSSVLLLSFLVVFYVSVTQIRRTLLPLEKLKHGTRRIAMKDFDSRVTVQSGDEFEELATSFNDMASRIGKQFTALTTISEIDRAILSSLDTDEIVKTVITRMPNVLSCNFVCFTLFDSVTEDCCKTCVWRGKSETVEFLEDIEIEPKGIEGFIGDGDLLLRKAGEGIPPYLVPFVGKEIRSFVFLPVFLNKKLTAMIVFGSPDSPFPDQQDLPQIRQLADQIAVALSNARLLKELDQLNWGTLSALARTVDAKSPWTAGHSERVTKWALKIGRALRMNSQELNNLHRAALVHDIGKIGVPGSILDKPGKLNDSEWRVVQSHPRLGVRILEPIATFKDLIPMVLQHHERFNGKGYPDGLAGQKIGLGARILAVADTFDALISDRPYRPGMKRETALEIIAQGAGEQFDPKIVRAFFQAISNEVSSQEKHENQSLDRPCSLENHEASSPREVLFNRTGAEGRLE